MIDVCIDKWFSKAILIVSGELKTRIDGIIDGAKKQYEIVHVCDVNRYENTTH